MGHALFHLSGVHFIAKRSDRLPHPESRSAAAQSSVIDAAFEPGALGGGLAPASVTGTEGTGLPIRVLSSKMQL